MSRSHHNIEKRSPLMSNAKHWPYRGYSATGVRYLIRRESGRWLAVKLIEHAPGVQSHYARTLADMSAWLSEG